MNKTEVADVPSRDEVCDAIGLYLGTLFSNVVESDDESLMLDARLADLTDAEVRQLARAVRTVCELLGVEP